eukprot:COSAG04_NODE_24831_length_316_cov_0.829493_1_plen_72_part_10
MRRPCLAAEFDLALTGETILLVASKTDSKRLPLSARATYVVLPIAPGMLPPLLPLGLGTFSGPFSDAADGKS